jgi:hypothetical protein
MKYFPMKVRKKAVELLQYKIMLKDLHEGEYEHITNLCNSYVNAYEDLYDLVKVWMSNNEDKVRELNLWGMTHEFNRARTNLKFRIKDSDRNYTLIWQGILEVRMNIRILVLILDLIVGDHHG